MPYEVKKKRILEIRGEKEAMKRIQEKVTDAAVEQEMCHVSCTLPQLPASGALIPIRIPAVSAGHSHPHTPGVPESCFPGQCEAEGRRWPKGLEAMAMSTTWRDCPEPG